MSAGLGRLHLLSIRVGHGVPFARGPSPGTLRQYCKTSDSKESTDPSFTPSTRASQLLEAINAAQPLPFTSTTSNTVATMCNEDLISIATVRHLSMRVYLYVFLSMSHTGPCVLCLAPPVSGSGSPYDAFTPSRISNARTCLVMSTASVYGKCLLHPIVQYLELHQTFFPYQPAIAAKMSAYRHAIPVFTWISSARSVWCLENACLSLGEQGGPR